MFRWNFLCFLCPLPPILSLSTIEKSLASASLHCRIRYLWTSVRSPQSLFSRAAQVNPKRQMNYSSYKKFLKSRQLSFMVVSFELGFFVFTFLVEMKDYISFRNKTFIEEKHLKIRYFTEKYFQHKIY